MTADVQRELPRCSWCDDPALGSADSSHGQVPSCGAVDHGHDFALSLPTVQALIADAERQAAAAALRAIERHVVRLGDVDVVNVLHVRRALDPSGAAEGAGR